MVVLFLCPCSSHVYVCVILCLCAHPCVPFGPPKFCSFSFLSCLLDGSVMVKERVPSPKLLRAQASGEHLGPMFMLFLCLDTFFLCLCACNLVFMCTPSCDFWAPRVLFSFFSFLFARVGAWWLRQKCHCPSFFKFKFQMNISTFCLCSFCVHVLPLCVCVCVVLCFYLCLCMLFGP